MRCRQSIDSKPLQGRPKHTERCPNKADTDQAVPIDPRFGIDTTVPGTRLYGMPHSVHPASHKYPPPGNEPGR
jgi:hypothetical protein